MMAAPEGRSNHTEQAKPTIDAIAAEMWTREQPIMVRPSSRPGFAGTVIELIGPLIISAGETFTQALMGREPAVRRLGEPTQGAFSDMLVRHLPNGWIFTLENEAYRTVDGTTFDVDGIPPDEVVPVFPERDLKAGRDGGLERIGVKRKR